jgi:hypothetical protein
LPVSFDSEIRLPPNIELMRISVSGHWPAFTRKPLTNLGR